MLSRPRLGGDAGAARGALRGRIGRVLGTVDWIGFLDLPTNILLPQLHHTRRDADALLQEAAVLAQGFG